MGLKWFTREKDAGGNDQWALLGLRNRGNGVPATIVVEGTVKCAICSGRTVDRLICEECTAAVSYLRSADNLDAFIRLMDFAAKPGMMTVLAWITDDAVGELMMERMEDARNRA